MIYYIVHTCMQDNLGFNCVLLLLCVKISTASAQTDIARGIWSMREEVWVSKLTPVEYDFIKRQVVSYLAFQ